MLYNWRWAWTPTAGRWSSRCGTIFAPKPASVRRVTGSTNTYSCCITDAEPEHALPGGEAAGAGTIFAPQPASVRRVTGSTNTYSCCITDAEPEHALLGGEAAGAGPSSRHSPPRSAGWQVVLILTHAVSLTLSLNTRCRAVKQQVRNHLRATARLGPRGDR